MAIWVTERGETRSGSWKISLTPRTVFRSRLPGKNGVRNRRRVKNLRRLIQSVESPKTRQSPKGRRTRVALFNASRIAFFWFSFPPLHRFSVSFPERLPLFLARARNFRDLIGKARIVSKSLKEFDTTRLRLFYCRWERKIGVNRPVNPDDLAN